MPEVSVIVPVYNCAGYIGKCADSILRQGIRSLELILVDDGSTDGTSRECDQIALKDDRVTVIHQKNRGVSAARNAGLDAAKGDWITFVDADDYLMPDALETVLAAAGSAQIVMFDLVTLWADGRTAPDTIPLLPESRIVERNDWTPALLAQMAGSACRCLYRKELLGDVRFPVGIKLSEDRLFNLAAMGKTKTLQYLKQGLYMRTLREGSACLSYHADYFENNIRAMAVARQLLERYWTEQYLAVYSRMFMLGGALMGIYQIASRAYQGKSRLGDIRAITDQPALKEVFELCQPEGLRERLLKRKANAALLLIGYLWNWKNRR